MQQLFYFGEPADPKFDKVNDPLKDEYGIDNYFEETVNLNIMKTTNALSNFDKIREEHKYLFNVYAKSMQSEENLENFAHDIR